MDKETVYINHGEIYKDENIKTCVRNYTYSNDGDELFSYTKNINSNYPNGKKYFFTKEMKSFYPEYRKIEPISLENYDLCPDVFLWVGLGAPTRTENQDYDLFFSFKDMEELKSVAEYYNLPFPISEDMKQTIINSPHKVNYSRIGDHYIIPASIQYRNGVPSLFKLYTYPTEIDGWSTWMKGFSYHNEGQLYESGSITQQLTGGKENEHFFTRGEGNYKRAERIKSMVDGETSTNYYFVKVEDGGDPIIMWEAEETNLITNVKRIKKYQSSKMIRQIIGNLTSGNNFEEYNLPSEISFVLGRSYYEDSNETEIFFVATNSDQLKSISDHYNLKVPYDDRLKNLLDNDPASMRVRHYDLLGLGEGKYVPVVACGLLFIDNIATQIKLYEFTRI